MHQQRKPKHVFQRCYWAALDRYRLHQDRKRFIGATVIVDGVEQMITSMSQSVIRVQKPVKLAPLPFPIDEAAWMIPAMEHALDANGEPIIGRGEQ